MSNARHQPDESATQAPTQTGSQTWRASANALRVPGLTLLYHPDLRRIGERTVLEELSGGRDNPLSRHTPDFAAPGSEVCRPLADARISRTPILLRPQGAGVVVDRDASGTHLVVDGHEVEHDFALPSQALEEGVVLLLGGRVVLLLHLLDPVADTVTPRFGLVGDSPSMAQLRRDIVRTADLTMPILLRGESGTGKELVARAIHDAGPRQQKPYVAINMAALPPNLAAAELFGAERGAYTGAERRRAGHFENASDGTLFLDEVGETPPEVQALLLRTLETGEIQTVGGTRNVRVNARILSATDADLESAIEDGRFRSPLLHRLSGYIIRLPPLRSRREDFGRLFALFLRRELETLGLVHLLNPRSRPWLPAPLIARLAAWHWPGNVRQLANVVRQLVVANREADPATRFDEAVRLLTETPPTLAPAVGAPAGGAPAGGAPAGGAPSETPKTYQTVASTLREQDVVAALRAHGFRPTAAADALGIPRPSIYDLIAKIPGLRRASELTREEIAEARARVGPSVEKMAAELEVSQRALRRRVNQLGLLIRSDDGI